MTDIPQPTPSEIKERRMHAMQTQSEAAAVVHVTVTAWQRWEAPEWAKSARVMPLGLWELYCLRTEHHIKFEPTALVPWVF